MSLLYKPDWKDVKQHYLAWWAHEAIGRCGMAVYAPRDNSLVLEPPQQPENPVDCWVDLDYVTARNRYTHERTYYGGEALPHWSGGYAGQNSLATYLGCPITLDRETGWIDPILFGDDWDVTRLKIDRDGYWWKYNTALLERSVIEAQGKSLPVIGAFGGPGDTLAWLRGTQQLLLDVALEPERVLAAEHYLMDLWIEVYEYTYRIVHATAEGSTGWFGLWSPGKFYASQCDFSYMISPTMFAKLFIPVIERQTNYLDDTVYHVDGICAFAHVPALLELPRLQALQILPGAGKPSPLHYLDTLRLVQSKGRNLHITIPPEEVEEALGLLSARGLFIETWCSSETQAKDLLRNAEKWSRDRG
ncbi:MAG: hypothetical protein LLG44_11300 [Chloroflexi bacterium]|nr:hypothetical protein [Chloroflexota bacterium]